MGIHEAFKSIQAYNTSFYQKLEKTQCNACVATTRIICGTSKEKLCQELGLESLENRRWFRKLMILLFKIFRNKSPSYLYSIIPRRNSSYTTRKIVFNTRHTYYKIVKQL